MARLIGSLASVWVVAGGCRLLSIRPVPCKQISLSVWSWQGALGASELEQAQRSQTITFRAFLVCLLLVSSWWPHQVKRRLGTIGNTGQIPRKALALQKSTRDIGSRSRAASISGEGQAAWGSCQQRQDSHAGHPLSSVQIQDERLGGDSGCLTLLSQKKGLRVRIFNISLLFWRSEGDNPDPLSAPSRQRRLWFLTVKRKKDNDTDNSYCVCTASAGERRPLRLSLARVRAVHNCNA